LKKPEKKFTTTITTPGYLGDVVTKENIKKYLLGAICLVLGWGVGTILHECGHLAGAYAFGLPATLGPITVSTGSVFVQGSMTGTQTAIVAIAGSLYLMIVGVLMVRLSSNPMVRMIGIVFLCRSWVDALPIGDLDGGILAGSVGYGIAMLIVVFEVLVCGGVILDTIPEGLNGDKMNDEEKDDKICKVGSECR